MTSEIDFVRAQYCLELSLVVLHVIFASKLTNLIDSFSVIREQTHVLSTSKWDSLYRVSKLRLYFFDYLGYLSVCPCTVNQSGPRVV
jgi:hypothetical protein